MGPTPNETARPTSSTSNSLPTGVDQGILHRRSTKLAQHAPRLLDLRGVAISEILDARKVPPTFTQFSNLPDVVRTLIWEFALNNNRRGTSPRLIQFTLNTRPKFDPSMTVRYHYNLHTLSGSGASTPAVVVNRESRAVFRALFPDVLQLLNGQEICFHGTRDVLFADIFSLFALSRMLREDTFQASSFVGLDHIRNLTLVALQDSVSGIHLPAAVPLLGARNIPDSPANFAVHLRLSRGADADFNQHIIDALDRLTWGFVQIGRLSTSDDQDRELMQARKSLLQDFRNFLDHLAGHLAPALDPRANPGVSLRLLPARYPQVFP